MAADPDHNAAVPEAAGSRAAETNDAPLSIAFIGFGEAGQAIGAGLAAEGARVHAYDLLFDGTERDARLTRAAALNVLPGASARDAAGGVDIVASTVTAGAAREVAEAAAAYLRPGQVFVDLNSVSPIDKRAGAEAIAATGAHYVEAAIMSPVHPRGHKVPMLFAGPEAEALAERLRPFGMDIGIAGAEFGAAAAIKMCRSIMIKGLEALTVECQMTARAYGVDEHVNASLHASYPGLDWLTHHGYLIDRVLEHGARRAEEMQCAAETIAAVGLDPKMTSSTAELQAWVAGLSIDRTGMAVGEVGRRVDRLLSAARNDKGRS